MKDIGLCVFRSFTLEFKLYIFFKEIIQYFDNPVCELLNDIKLIHVLITGHTHGMVGYATWVNFEHLYLLNVSM